MIDKKASIVDKIKNFKADSIYKLITLVEKDDETKQWFMEEYCFNHIDMYIFYLNFVLQTKMGNPELIDLMLNIQAPENLATTFCFEKEKEENKHIEDENDGDLADYDLDKLMNNDIGNDDIDTSKVKSKFNKVEEIDEDIVELQLHAKTIIQSIWDAILRKSDRDYDTTLKILKMMNTKIFPKVSKPIIFSDFIISAYDLIDNIGDKSKLAHKDIVLSIHALSSLFILLANHGLDYTSINYYTKLYRLLDYLKNIFRMKEKEKFLRLLELSLKSPMLPSIIAASFIKKLLRVIITEHIEQASTWIWAVSFVCNVIKKHAIWTKMINVPAKFNSSRLQRIEERKLKKREGKEYRKKKEDWDNPIFQGLIKKDIFSLSEVDPMKTQALNSCLWEAVPLLNHSLKIVRDYASILCTDFQSKKSLPSDELAKLEETQLIHSQLEEIEKIKTLKPKEIERIDGIYAGYDEEGEKRFEEKKDRFFEEQIELFHPKGSLLTRKY